MKEIQLYAIILEWLSKHETQENRDVICYKAFCDKVSDKKELAEFIKNFAIL